MGKHGYFLHTITFQQHICTYLQWGTVVDYLSEWSILTFIEDTTHLGFMFGRLDLRVNCGSVAYFYSRWRLNYGYNNLDTNKFKPAHHHSPIQPNKNGSRKAPYIFSNPGLETSYKHHKGKSMKRRLNPNNCWNMSSCKGTGRDNHHPSENCTIATSQTACPTLNKKGRS